MGILDNIRHFTLSFVRSSQRNRIRLADICYGADASVNGHEGAFSRLFDLTRRAGDISAWLTHMGASSL